MAKGDRGRPLERLAKLKARVEEVRGKRDRARGRLEEVLRQLKAEHGVSTLEGGEALLRERKAEAKAAAKALDVALARFEKKWKKRLDGN